MSERVAIYQQKAETHNQVRRCDGCKWWQRNSECENEAILEMVPEPEGWWPWFKSPPNFHCAYWRDKDEA